jgi:hypothetical protein
MNMQLYHSHGSVYARTSLPALQPFASLGLLDEEPSNYLWLVPPSNQLSRSVVRSCNTSPSHLNFCNPVARFEDILYLLYTESANSIFQLLVYFFMQCCTCLDLRHSEAGI